MTCIHNPDEILKFQWKCSFKGFQIYQNYLCALSWCFLFSLSPWVFLPDFLMSSTASSKTLPCTKKKSAVKKGKTLHKSLYNNSLYCRQMKQPILSQLCGWACPSLYSCWVLLWVMSFQKRNTVKLWVDAEEQLKLHLATNVWAYFDNLY